MHVSGEFCSTTSVFVTTPTNMLQIPLASLSTLQVVFSLSNPKSSSGDEMESIHEECKSPTHIIKEWLPFCEDELKPREGLEFMNLEDKDFVKLVDNKVIMTVVIALQNLLLDVTGGGPRGDVTVAECSGGL
uniref:Uncharacterized protein n=1 Tax=Opuntia streptacantha TaxID=393608 RepID=A0A7C8Z4H0_OPUST